MKRFFLKKKTFQYSRIPAGFFENYIYILIEFIYMFFVFFLKNFIQFFLCLVQPRTFILQQLLELQLPADTRHQLAAIESNGLVSGILIAIPRTEVLHPALPLIQFVQVCCFAYVYLYVSFLSNSFWYNIL